MIDLELLNFLIAKLEMCVEYDTLYLSLPAYEHCYRNTYRLELSNDLDQIMGFLGYDTTTNYRIKMTDKTLFEFLTTTKKVQKKYIAYDEYKSKKPQHTRFLKFLTAKQYDRSDENLQDYKEAFHKHAIAFFGKQKEYQTYEYQYNFLTKLEEKRKLLPNSCDFNKFVILHGVNTLVNMEDEEFIQRWVKFKRINWSQLSIFCE